jgi:formylglycine-generating enzyme required for sulfatase activity
MKILLAVLVFISHATAAELPRVKDCADCPDLIVLPAGRFLMGANDERPQFGPQVDVAITQPFALAVSEVSFDQYQRCVDAGACKAVASDHGWGRGPRPVINVSWDDAQRYTAWLSRLSGKKYRLPSEAEWEYAARGGTVSRYPWGPAIGSGNANCRDCGSKPWGGDQSAPVGSFPANQFGFRDMLGNVSEWTADCWFERHQTGETAQAPRAGDCQKRVTRGGDWYYIPALSTSSARMGNVGMIASYTIGFRVARDATAEELSARR